MALGTEGAAPRAAADTPPAQAPEELIEIQLRNILESTQTSAGAVCLYDHHQELLRLAVENGLSDEGCRRLRSVRRGGATTWDMPLHSLLNRRVYLIESASKNRYVPPLVDDVGLVSAVACIPLYDGSSPVGSLILVALVPRPFGERQIRLLEQPVRELVGTIVAMRKRVNTAPVAHSARSSLSASATPRPAAPASGPTAPGLKTAPAATGGSASASAADEESRAELERLRARLAEAQATAAAAGKRGAELEARNAELHERIRTLAAERDDASGSLTARTRELAVVAERIAELERALDEVRRAEGTLRAELEHARTTSASERTQAARLHEVEAINEGLTARVGELEARELSLRAETDARIVSAVAEAEAAAATATTALEARIAAVSAECAAASRELERREHERAAAVAREGALAARVREVEAELERRHDENAQLRNGFAHLESLLQAQIRARNDAGGEPDDGDAASIEVVELDLQGGLDFADDDGDEAGGLVVEEVEPASSAPAPGPVFVAAAAAEGLLVIDVERAWPDVAATDATVAVAAPDAAVTVATHPKWILVNLAAPNALAALADLRRTGRVGPSFGCIALPGQDRGLFLGRLEVARRPLDPDGLLATLREAVPRGTKVVTAGADVEGLISLRQALGRLGASVSMAWNAKQAGDLFGMVRPEVAIIDLELPPNDGCALVARMSLRLPTRLTVVIPKATDTAAAFAAAAAHPELLRAALSVEELVARVVAVSEEIPAAR